MKKLIISVVVLGILGLGFFAITSQGMESEKQLRISQSKTKSYQDEVLRMNKVLGSLNGTLSKKDKEIQKLKSQLNKVSKENKSLNTKVSKQDRTIEQMNHLKTLTKDEIDSKKLLVKTIDKKVNKLEKKYTDLSNRYGLLNYEYKQLQGSINLIEKGNFKWNPKSQKDFYKKYIPDYIKNGFQRYERKEWYAKNSTAQYFLPKGITKFSTSLTGLQGKKIVIQGENKKYLVVESKDISSYGDAKVFVKGTNIEKRWNQNGFLIVGSSSKPARPNLNVEFYNGELIVTGTNRYNGKGKTYKFFIDDFKPVSIKFEGNIDGFTFNGK